MSARSLFSYVNPGSRGWNSASGLMKTAISRKKSLAAIWDGSFWAGAKAERQVTLGQTTIAQFLLPQALTRYRVSSANNTLIDVLLSYGGFTAALQLLSIVRGLPAFAMQASPISRNFGLAPAFALLIVLLNSGEGVYNGRVRGPQAMRWSLGKSVIWAAVIASICFSGREKPAVLAGMLIIGSVSSYLALCLWRTWRWHVTADRRAKGQGVRRVVIIGAGELGQECARALFRNHDCEGVLVGFLDDEMKINGEVIGRPEALTEIARAQFVDEVILAIPHNPELTARIVREARHCHLDVKTVPQLFGEGLVEYLGRLPLLTLHAEPAPALGPWAKRAFDWLLSIAILFLITPLMALIAVAIKADSRGPVFYRAPRAGKKGKTFFCFKFRTMVADADRLKESLRAQNQRSGVFFKMAGDPRITRLGRFLRRYSLDELPQLWNVARGEMSMVGPRPHPLDDCRRYQLEYLRRLDVRPGITGLWQVTARRDPSFGRGLALDLEYIARWNFWLDIRILFKTAGAVLQGNGE